MTNHAERLKALNEAIDVPVVLSACPTCGPGSTRSHIAGLWHCYQCGAHWESGAPKESGVAVRAMEARATLALAARIVEATKEHRRLYLACSDKTDPHLLIAGDRLDALLRQWASDTGTGEDEAHE